MWTHPSQTPCLPPPSLPPAVNGGIAAKDSVFSAAWNALRFPGTRHSVTDAPAPPQGLYPATAALCQTLLNSGRTLWVDPSDRSLLHQWCLWRTEGLLVASPQKADFTLVTCPSRMPALYHLNIGDGRDPATATTLFIQVPTLDPEREFVWNPKSAGACLQKSIPGLPQAFYRQRSELQEMLPWGIDIFFIHEHSFVALPRSVHVAALKPA